MVTMRKNLFGLLAILCTLLLWVPINTVSASEEGFFVRPILPKDQVSSVGYYHLKLSPGQSKTLEVTVNNEMDQEIQVSIDAANGFSNPYGNMNYSVEEETDYSRFLDDSYKLRNMINIQDSVTVGPNQEKKVSFRITIPEDTVNGQLLGAVQFTAKVKDSDDKNNTDKEAAFNVDIKQRYTIGILIDLPNKSGTKVEVGKTKIGMNTSNPKVITQIKNMNPVIAKGLALKYEVYSKGSAEAIFEGDQDVPSLAPVTTLEFPIDWNHSTIQNGDYSIIGILYEKETGKAVSEIKNSFEVVEEEVEKFNDQFGSSEEGITPTAVLSKKWSWVWLLLLIAGIYAAYCYGKRKKGEELKSQEEDLQ